MLSSRRILGAIVTTGLLSMGTTALRANAGDHDRYVVDQAQYNAGSGDDMTPVQAYSTKTLPLNRGNDRH